MRKPEITSIRTKLAENKRGGRCWNSGAEGQTAVKRRHWNAETRQSTFQKKQNRGVDNFFLVPVSLLAARGLLPLQGAHSHTRPLQKRQDGRMSNRCRTAAGGEGGHGECVWQTPAVVTTGRTTAATFTTAALSLSVYTEVIRQGISVLLVLLL